jgi:hypothetical protein
MHGAMLWHGRLLFHAKHKWPRESAKWSMKINHEMVLMMVCHLGGFGKN